MLRQLHITNLALIEDAVLDLQSGMTAITGETGAGKSLILDALALLSGARATPSLVRSGADRAVVEAAFDISGRSDAMKALADAGLETSEEHEVILRREVTASGRSRAWINGRMAPLSQLAEIASHLLEINGQHDQQSLLEQPVQRDFFDEFAGLLPLRAKVATAYTAVLTAQADVDALHRQDREREQRRDFLRFQVDEIEALGLAPGELAELESERIRLDNLDGLLRLGAGAVAGIAEGNEQSSALDLLGAAIGSVEEMAELDPALKPIAESLLEAQARLSDAGYELGRYIARLEADPARLDQINGRIDAIRKGLRRHGGTEEEVIARAAHMREELDRLENWETEREAAGARLAAAKELLAAHADALSAERKKSAKAFVRPLLALLKDFAMPKVRLEIQLAPLTQGISLADARLCSATGLEDVEILFSANEGENLHPLRRVASGGELSRVMLALRTMGTRGAAIPLMVFDEVDAGISGTAARRVAERLAALGERCQLLCVTHNASIASIARHHLLVEKMQSKGRTLSHPRLIEGRHRQEELARLLDGGQLSEEGLALAAEMLRIAG